VGGGGFERGGLVRETGVEHCPYAGAWWELGGGD